jgi:pimeloyl-ACP methyl ester carboxylesterase
MVSCQLLDGAGHWVQQEQAEQVIPLLLDFLASRRRKPDLAQLA